MSEIFKEYLIKQKKSPKDILAQTGIAVAAFFLCAIIFVLGGNLIGPIVICGVLYGTYYLFGKFSREYEYILTNNEVDIDVIYNRNSRKRVITVDLRKIDIMASIEDKAHAGDINKKYKLINASDNNNGADTYAIVGQSDQYGSFKILLTPNETMLDDMFKQSPSKIFKYK